MFHGFRAIVYRSSSCRGSPAPPGDGKNTWKFIFCFCFPRPRGIRDLGAQSRRFRPQVQMQHSSEERNNGFYEDGKRRPKHQALEQPGRKTLFNTGKTRTPEAGNLTTGRSRCEEQAGEVGLARLRANQQAQSVNRHSKSTGRVHGPPYAKL